MTDLTLLVRLNESVPVGPVTLPSAGGPVSGNPVIVMVSAVGAGTIMPGSFSDSASFYQNKVVKPAKATKAAGTIKRIVDPNDAQQTGAGNFADGSTHIDVADTSKTYQQQGSGSDYQLTKVYYADVPAEQANTATVGTWADNGEGQTGVEYASGFSDGGDAAGSGNFTDGSGDEGDAPDGMGGNDSGGDGGGGGGGGGGE